MNRMPERRSGGLILWKKPTNEVGCGIALILFGLVFSIPFWIADPEQTSMAAKVSFGISGLGVAVSGVLVALFQDRLTIDPAAREFLRVRGFWIFAKVSKGSLNEMASVEVKRRLVSDEGSVSTFIDVILRWKPGGPKPFQTHALNESLRYLPSGRSVTAQKSNDAETAREFGRRIAWEWSTEFAIPLDDQLSPADSSDSATQAVQFKSKHSTVLSVERHSGGSSATYPAMLIRNKAFSQLGFTAPLFLIGIVSLFTLRNPLLGIGFVCLAFLLGALIVWPNRPFLLATGSQVVFRVDQATLSLNLRQNGIEQPVRQMDVADIRSLIPHFAATAPALIVQTSTASFEIRHGLRASDLEALFQMIREVRPDL